MSTGADAKMDIRPLRTNPPPPWSSVVPKAGTPDGDAGERDAGASDQTLPANRNLAVLVYG
jgi:hypothetical protein